MRVRLLGMDLDIYSGLRNMMFQVLPIFLMAAIFAMAPVVTAAAIARENTAGSR